MGFKDIRVQEENKAELKLKLDKLKAEAKELYSELVRLNDQFNNSDNQEFEKREFLESAIQEFKEFFTEKGFKINKTSISSPTEVIAYIENSEFNVQLFPNFEEFSLNIKIPAKAEYETLTVVQMNSYEWKFKGYLLDDELSFPRAPKNPDAETYQEQIELLKEDIEQFKRYSEGTAPYYGYSLHSRNREVNSILEYLEELDNKY
ncbi:hypothetical protein AAXE64_06780 [Priestia megaterium]